MNENNESIVVQDYYQDDLAVCYGCGRNNAHGLHIRTHWDGEKGIAYFEPRAEHTAYPGVVYGGLLASLIDCHSIGTAVARFYHDEGRAMDSLPDIRCVTGKLSVSYLKPTPLGITLRLESTISEITERKAIVITKLYADDVETVRGETIAVRVNMGKLRDSFSEQ